MANRTKFNTQQALDLILEDYDSCNDCDSISNKSSECEDSYESDCSGIIPDTPQKDLPVKFSLVSSTTPTRKISKISKKKLFNNTPSRRRTHKGKKTKSEYFRENIIWSNCLDSLDKSQLENPQYHENRSPLLEQTEHTTAVGTKSPEVSITIDLGQLSPVYHGQDQLSDISGISPLTHQTPSSSPAHFDHDEHVSGEVRNLENADSESDLDNTENFSCDGNSSTRSNPDEIDLENHEFTIEVEDNPPSPVNNPNYFERPNGTRPLECYPGDEILPEDVENGWIRPLVDDIPLQGQFSDVPRIKVQMIRKKPEDFFALFFNETMYDSIAIETNKYARQRIATQRRGRDPVEQIEDADYTPFDRLTGWKDLNASDIRIFLGHIILMSLVRKSAVRSYWSTNQLISTPYFGKYLSRNKFQSILWNLHVNDNSRNPPPGCENHDPLGRVRNIISMAQKNFTDVYTPGCNVAVDESCLGYKGRVKFLCFNKNKPQKFHIRLFMVSEQDSGYIIAFSVYTGKNCKELKRINATLDPDASITTKTVMGLLQLGKLLDAHRRVWFDNYYTSCELLLELLARDTYAAGTCKSSRRGLPKAVAPKTIKLRKSESVFRRKENILCIKWCDKRSVLMLSTIHAAEDVHTNTRYNGEEVRKPLAIADYNNNMNAVDHTDHFLSNYSPLKGNKWYRKLFFHIFHLCLLNSYILNRKFGTEQMSHQSYREYIANHLISSSLDTSTCRRQRARPETVHQEQRLQGKHFPVKFPLYTNAKRKYPAKRCRVCNFTEQQRAYNGYPGRKLSVRHTTFTCTKCEGIPLCISPCFQLFHTEVNYRKKALECRLEDRI